MAYFGPPPHQLSLESRCGGRLEYMKKDLFIGGFVLLVALIAIVTYAVLRPAPVKAPEKADVSGLTADSYVEHAPYYDIEAYYATSTPLLASVGTSADANAVALMKTFVSTTIAQFKTDGNFANLTSEDIKMMGFDSGRKESLKIVYLIAPASHSVTYIFTVYENTLGAHGNMFFHTISFDMATGKPLALTDLFLPSSSYLTTLSSIARKELPSVIGGLSDTEMIAGGTAPEEKNFQNFFFDNQNLVLLFPPYQVAAYAAGPQTLRIPISELSTILKPDYR